MIDWLNWLIVKAFDTVDNRILLNILNNAGISNSEHKWFTSYFTERKQRTTYN